MNSELKRKIRAVFEVDADYPKALRELADPPAVLYVIGRWPLPEDVLAIGIVGSRLASTYGRQAATRLTTDLVRRGVMTVSGLASGVDTCAHRATLVEKGWTVAVLGHGFNYEFPKENAALFSQIANEGTLLTEFPYEMPPLSANFPQRNRIISGLSQGVVVVEASGRSGALITARCAAEQGRDVFAVPGGIFNPLSLGCHRLIKEGAKLVETAEDVLVEYGFSEASHTGSFRPVKAKGEPLNKAEEGVLAFLSDTPISVDELVELSGTPVDRLAEVLLSLELKERVRSLSGQRYVTHN